MKITKLATYFYKGFTGNTNCTDVSTMFWKYELFYIIIISLITIREG